MSLLQNKDKVSQTPSESSTPTELPTPYPLSAKFETEDQSSSIVDPGVDPDSRSYGHTPETYTEEPEVVLYHRPKVLIPTVLLVHLPNDGKYTMESSIHLIETVPVFRQV